MIIDAIQVSAPILVLAQTLLLSIKTPFLQLILHLKGRQEYCEHQGRRDPKPPRIEISMINNFKCLRLKTLGRSWPKKSKTLVGHITYAWE